MDPPPLGKWIIALLGVGPPGLRPIGWRLPSAMFGVAGVVLLYFLALKLWGSVWWVGCPLALLPVALFIVARRPPWQEALAFGAYATIYLLGSRSTAPSSSSTCCRRSL